MSDFSTGKSIPPPRLTIEAADDGTRIVRCFGLLSCRACGHVPGAFDFVGLIVDGSLVCRGCFRDLVTVGGQ
jgi:hypothetical protein